MILLDTHVALWIMIDPESLGKRTRQMAARALSENQAGISAVSFWEVAPLIAKRRLRSVDSAGMLRRDIFQIGVTELPLTGDIAVLGRGLISA